jgi:hypothetical protein
VGVGIRGPVADDPADPSVLQMGGNVPRGATHVDVRRRNGALIPATFEYHGTWWVWLGPKILADPSFVPWPSWRSMGSAGPLPSSLPRPLAAGCAGRTLSANLRRGGRDAAANGV